MNEAPLIVEVLPRDQDTIAFFGTIPANSNRTFVSKRITYPFRLDGLRIHFALGTNRTLRVKLYISPDDSAPTAEPLSGENVLDAAGQVDYIVGDDEPIDFPYAVRVEPVGMYLKLHCVNTDSWDHTVTGYVFITRKERVMT